MDTAARFASHAVESSSETQRPAIPTIAKGLTVTATYRLSEQGRKASLLGGGDGRAVQQIRLEVPAARLHLVTVDADGRASLKLRPRFELDAQQRVMRVDAPPIYEASPSIDELLRDAARYHQLERAYHAERTATRAAGVETQRGLRKQIAQAFLADRTQRAIVHPAPTLRRCFVATQHGRLLFDVATDESPAREVPPEAHRRFRADLRARHERNQQERARQLALHEEKKRFIADWIAAHGTPEQQARQAAGVLPMDEGVEAITDQVFVHLSDFPRYTRDGARQLQAHLRQLPGHADAVVTPNEVVVTSADAVKATAAQWALVQALQEKAPGANVTLRVHRLSWHGHPSMAVLSIFGVLVTCKIGPFSVRREFAAP